LCLVNPELVMGLQNATDRPRQKNPVLTVSPHSANRCKCCGRCNWKHLETKRNPIPFDFVVY